MPSSYTGNDAAIVNFDTTDPQITIPSDGDAEGAASVNIALQKLADYIDHIRKVFDAVNPSTTQHILNALQVDGRIQGPGGTPLLIPGIRLHFKGTATVLYQYVAPGWPMLSAVATNVGSAGNSTITFAGNLPSTFGVHVILTPGQISTPVLFNCYQANLTTLNMFTIDRLGNGVNIGVNDDWFLTLFDDS